MRSPLWHTASVIAAGVVVATLPSMAEANILWGLQPAGRMSMLRPRKVINPETVVLADCMDVAGVISSQMAYFPGSPGPQPQDVAVVPTNPKESALWVNSETAARFTATNTVFVATIGPKVAQGMFAGTGNNGYGNFSCWEYYAPRLYRYGGTVCSQVYFCDHRQAPAVTEDSGAQPDSPDGAGSSSSGGGLSEPALIGIVVSLVGIAAIIAAAAAVLWFKRRLRRKELGESYDHESTTRGCCGLFAAKKRDDSESQNPIQDNVSSRGVGTELPQDHGRNEMPCGSLTQEADGRSRRLAIEMADTTDKFELDAGQDGIWSDVTMDALLGATEMAWRKEKAKETVTEVESPVEVLLVSPLSRDGEASKCLPEGQGRECGREDGPN